MLPHFFPKEKVFPLTTILKEQELPVEGIYKIRFVYSNHNYMIEILPYQITPIESISCVSADDVEYSYKYAHREALLQLKKEAKTDEVIFVKNGLVTDSSYANLVFFDGTEWVTPTTFLLNGTCRQRLLSERKIKERIIHATDIPSFTHIGLINAMIDLGELCLPLDQIFIDE